MIQRFIWRWLGRARINHEDVGVQYTAITKVGEAGNAGDIESLIQLLSHDKQTIRNAASRGIQNIIRNNEENPEKLQKIQDNLLEQFEGSSSLVERISIIEALEPLDLKFREELLGPLLEESENDLKYVIIQSLSETTNVEMLDAVLDAANTADLVLRRMALKTWYTGVASQELDDVLDYCTPRLHYLIRASYELQTSGEFLREVLSYANEDKLPQPKAYPDFIIRYITELMGEWEYDPEGYRSLHSIMVPSYFTLQEDSGEGERPYIIL